MEKDTALLVGKCLEIEMRAEKAAVEGPHVRGYHQVEGQQPAVDVAHLAGLDRALDQPAEDLDQ